MTTGEYLKNCVHPSCLFGTILNCVLLNFCRVLNVLDGQEKLNSKDGRSTMNEKEATLVANIIRIILDSPMSLSRSIGVITFYQAQRHCIISAVQKR